MKGILPHFSHLIVSATNNIRPIDQNHCCRHNIQIYSTNKIINIYWNWLVFISADVIFMQHFKMKEKKNILDFN